MTDKSDKSQGDNQSRKRLDLAKRELQSIVDKIDELGGRTSRALGLWRINKRLRNEEFKHKRRYFWRITVIAIIIYFFAKNYMNVNFNGKVS